jgi:type III secretion protein O
MTLFADLLDIKKFRERQAEVALVRQRLRRAAADKARQEADIALAAYQRQARAREAGLYSDLCSRVVKRRDIEDVQQQVATLKTNEQGYQEALQGAVDNLDRESQVLQECGVAHQHAVRMTAKFVNLEDAYLDGVLREREYKEDREMEEASAALNRRIGWDFTDMEV